MRQVVATHAAPLPGRENQRGVVGAVTLIPGVLLSGARDGMIRKSSSRTGQLLWEFDSAKEFETVLLASRRRYGLMCPPMK